MAGPRIMVLYDDQCAFCCSQVRWLARLDWCRTAEFRPRTDPSAAALMPGVTAEDLKDAIHALSPAGVVYRGARCLRHLGMRIPLLAVPSLLLWLPGVLGLADRAYGWVSRNRHRLGRVWGCSVGCHRPPPGSGPAGGAG